MRPNAIQIIVVITIGVLTFIGIGTLCWCAIFKIYIEPTMMISLNGLTFGLAGSLTTILVGRTVQQLAQPQDTDTTIRQTTETITKPKAVESPPIQNVKVVNDPEKPEEKIPVVEIPKPTDTPAT